MEARSLYTLITVLNIRYKWLKYLLHPKTVILIVLLVITGSNTKAQSMLGSLTTNSNPVIPFVAISEYENGLAIIDQTITINTMASMNWVLKVRAAANPELMGTQIPLNNFGLKVTNIPGAPPEILLSTADQDIATGTSASAMQTIPVEIRYRAKGGNDFLKPAGDYTTTLTFTLTMVTL